jgi:ABC-type phosphate/phosphonate transport system substrate-binding protein
MRLVSEEERLETLEALRQRRADLFVQIQALPLVRATQRAKQLELQLEEAIKDCEDRIDVFTQSIVFAKDDPIEANEEGVEECEVQVEEREEREKREEY